MSKAVFGRVAAYTFGLLGVLWVAENFFGDTYTAITLLFLLLSVVIEMIADNVHRGLRALAFLVCVLCLGACGALLLHQGMSVKAQAQSGPPDTRHQ